MTTPTSTTMTPFICKLFVKHKQAIDKTNNFANIQFQQLTTFQSYGYFNLHFKDHLIFSGWNMQNVWCVCKILLNLQSNEDKNFLFFHLKSERVTMPVYLYDRNILRMTVHTDTIRPKVVYEVLQHIHHVRRNIVEGYRIVNAAGKTFLLKLFIFVQFYDLSTNYPTSG